MGSLVYFIHFKKKKNFLVNYFIIPFSYFLIFYSITNISTDRFYPNIYTLLPLIGGTIILIYENKLSITYRFITNKILIFFGLISFSLYLYHHSLISIFNYLYFNINLYQKFLIFLFSIIISFLSFKYIEKPFRNKNIFSKKIFFFIIFFLSLINIFIGIYIYNNNSKKEYSNKLYSDYSYSADLLDINFLQKEIQKKNNNLEIIKNYENTNILVIGDSHGVDFSMILRNYLPLKADNNINFYNIELHHFTRNKLDDLEKVNIFFKDKIFKDSDIIIISDSIYSYKILKELKNDLDGIRYLSRLLKNKKKIILVNQSPYFLGNFHPVKTIILRNRNNYKLSDQEMSQELYKLIPLKILELNKKLKEIAEEEDIPLFDLFSIYCSNIKKECKFKDDKNHLLFFDTNHISDMGIRYISKDPKLNNLLYIVNKEKKSIKQ